MKYRPPLALVPRPPVLPASRHQSAAMSPLTGAVHSFIVRRQHEANAEPRAARARGSYEKKDDDDGDGDDAAWLLVRPRRPRRRRRQARTCSLEAPRVDVSGSGAGPVGARSRWRTLLEANASGTRQTRNSGRRASEAPINGGTTTTTRRGCW
jgi:hypothetical protein